MSDATATAKKKGTPDIVEMGDAQPQAGVALTPPPPPPVTARTPGPPEPPLPGRKKKPELTLTQEWSGKLDVGMTVHWYESGRRDDIPRPAVVMRTSPNGVALQVLDFSYRSAFKNVDGVRHVDDPTVPDFERDEQGAFGVPVWLQLLFKVIE